MTKPVFLEPSLPESSAIMQAPRQAWICTCTSSRCTKILAAAYAETAVKEFTYFITLYGPPASNVLRVVELPDDTVPSAWAPSWPLWHRGESPAEPITACWPMRLPTSGGEFR